MGAKIQVFKDPYFDRARETEDLMNQFKEMIDTNREKDRQKEELER